MQRIPKFSNHHISFYCRQVKENKTKAGTLRRSQQKSAQMLEEARKRQEEVSEDVTQLKVSHDHGQRTVNLHLTTQIRASRIGTLNFLSFFIFFFFGVSNIYTHFQSLDLEQVCTIKGFLENSKWTDFPQ